MGDKAILVKFNDNVTPTLNQQIRSLCLSLQNQTLPGIVEWVPSFDTVTIYYQPDKLSYEQVSEHIHHLSKTTGRTNTESYLIEVPVLYGNEYGIDMERVAQSSNLPIEKVIEMHSKPEYLVYMIGFLPGFPYVGGLPERLATPRLESPRSKVPAGSVGIAGSQTGIYPLESPGGWNIIGRTPLRLFNPKISNPFLFKAGDYIRFKRITEDEYQQIERDIQENRYTIRKEVR
ncbi:5-oxoprolinase subunit PxpB [Ornithinibacillus halophilus]|nr:5-oxoprolinase subunit PxpB [Ornithinibacillus halophilus]